MAFWTGWTLQPLKRPRTGKMLSKPSALCLILCSGLTCLISKGCQPWPYWAATVKKVKCMNTNGNQQEKVRRLQKLAARVRRRDLQMIYKAKLGHIGGDFSATDILVTLYSEVLKIDPKAPTAPDRDRFILSKGHCAGALYTTLAFMGFFPEDELNTFVEPLSKLNGHPNRK